MNLKQQIEVRFDDILHAVAQLPGQRQDANETMFLARQLEEIRARTYDIKRAPLDGMRFVPLDTSVSPGAETVTYRQYEALGFAKLISDYAKDWPTSNAVAREFTSKVKSIGSSYEYSFQEMRAAQFSGVPLAQAKANAARVAIEQKHDDLIQTGDSAQGLLGFLNQSNTTTFSVPNGASGTATWASKTPDEIVADMHDIVNGIATANKGRADMVPNALLLPLAQYALVASRRMGDGSNVTILQHFLESNPYFSGGRGTVDAWHILSTAGSGGTRMVAYRRDPECLQYIAPVVFEQFAPQVEGAVTKTLCHGRSGGVVVYYPTTISYGDGI